MRPIYLISKTPYPGVIHVPLLTIHFFTPEINFDLYSGIIVTSKQAAEGLKQYAPDWDRVSVICVGEETAHAIKKLGARYVEIADGYGMSILETLSVHNGKWLYLRPKMIASQWPVEARELGISVDEVIIYETTCNEKMETMEIAPNGVLIFTSPSSIVCFCKRYKIVTTQKVIVIGKTTQNSLPHGIKSILSEKKSVVSCVEKAREIATF
ncbi:MAG: uroporphyrinogen-III synthase [Sulfuricurvum sp.]|nr:uroporphyrinogen-III synthase [Sulfuricurvum sp.]